VSASAVLLIVLLVALAVAVGEIVRLRRRSMATARLAEAVIAQPEGRLGGLASLQGELAVLRDAIDDARERHRLAAERGKGAAEAAARRASSLLQLVVELDQLTYAASHDLRAPLQSIERLVSFIEDDLAEVALEESTRKHLRLIRGRVRRMNGLLSGIDELARAGRGADEVDEEDMAAVVAGAAELAEVPEGFVVRYVGGPATIVTALDPLEQVLRKLIHNAVVHHDRASGTVEVTCHDADAGRYEIRVSDDGPGIPKREHDKVFRMFRTVERRDVKDVAGIGLAVVKKVVESAGGEVRLASDGRGTTVTFTWPKQWQREGTVVRAFNDTVDERMAR
jgi:signal transduction histidine kinase